MFYYFNPSTPEVRRSINTTIGKCFKKNNQELNENLEKTFGKLYIPKINKLRDYQLSIEIMIIVLFELSSKT